LIIRRYHKTDPNEEGHYLVRQLIARIPYQPFTRALEYIIREREDRESLDIRVDAERWGYNVGTSSILLLWGEHEREIEPGASFLIRPNVAHAFRNLGDDQGKLSVMQVKPEAGDPIKELSLIQKYAGDEGVQRVHTENTQWFDAA